MSGLVFASTSIAGAGATQREAAAAPLLTVYSVPVGLQYINSEDDSARGHSNNPLNGTDNKLAPKSSGGGDGPFAGDIAVYSINLFSNATLKQRAGTGVYTCYFNYDKHALCQAYYKLKTGSTLVASGPVDFNKSGFTIVITGGTNTYLGVRGQVDVSRASARNVQRVNFQMVR